MPHTCDSTKYGLAKKFNFRKLKKLASRNSLNFCVDRHIKTNEYIVKTCKDKRQKCCPLSQALDSNSKQCKNINSTNKDSSFRFLGGNLDFSHIEESPYECSNLELGRLTFEQWKTIYSERKHTNFCIDKDSENQDQTLYKICETCSPKNPCVNYCCPIGTVTNEAGDCVQQAVGGYHWRPSVSNKSHIGLACPSGIITEHTKFAWRPGAGMMVDCELRQSSQYCVSHKPQETVVLLCQAM